MESNHYKSIDLDDPSTKDVSNRVASSNPLQWHKRTWAGISVAIIVAVVIGVAVGVSVTKANRYPDYSALSYTLEDTCKYDELRSLSLSSFNNQCTLLDSGTNFFDNFDYFEGYDPSSGFVHYVPKETAESLVIIFEAFTFIHKS